MSTYTYSYSDTDPATIKEPPSGAERKALQAAQAAAEAAHDDILDATHAGATPYIFPDVIEAAQAAYEAAGGKRSIVVRACGNSTHRVISVVVQILRRDAGGIK